MLRVQLDRFALNKRIYQFGRKMNRASNLIVQGIEIAAR